jgi:hypothetical protein
MEVRPSLIVSFMFGASTSKTFKQFYHMPKCVGVAPRSLDVGDAPASLIQVDIGGHPPFPTGSKQFSGHFGNLLFLAVFRVLNFWSRFEALNDIFWGMLRLQNSIMEFFQKCCSPRIDLSNELSYA